MDKINTVTRYSIQDRVFYELRWYHEQFVLWMLLVFFRRETFMLLQVILLIVGFVILIKGADFFVDGASSTAQNFKVSKMLIGLTIVAFGTSAPEICSQCKSTS